MANQTSRLEIEVDAAGAITRITTFGRAMNRAADSTDRFSTSTGRATTSTSNFKKTLATLGAAAAARQITQLATSVIKLGADFEQSITTAAAVMNVLDDSVDGNAASFERLTELALTLGETTEFTASQAASGLKFLGQAGFTATQSIEALPGVLDLATASQIDLGRASDITTDVLTAMGLEVSQLAEVNDVLVATITSSNTNMELLAESLKFAAPTASAFGTSLSTLNALIGQLGNAGIKGSLAGTQLSQAFTKADKVFARYGQTLKSGETATGDLVGAIDILNDRGASATEILDIFGLIAGRSMITLTRLGGDAIRSYADELENAEGRAQSLADAMRNTTAGAIKELQSAVEGVQLAAFQSESLDLEGSLRGLTTSIRDNQEAFETFLTVLLQLSDWAIRGGSAVIERLDNIGTLIGQVAASASLLDGGLFVDAIDNFARASGFIDDGNFKTLDEQLKGITESTNDVAASSADLAAQEEALAILIENTTAGLEIEKAALTATKEEKLEQTKALKGEAIQRAFLQKLTADGIKITDGNRAAIKEELDAIIRLSDSIEDQRAQLEGTKNTKKDLSAAYTQTLKDLQDETAAINGGTESLEIYNRLKEAQSIVDGAFDKDKLSAVEYQAELTKVLGLIQQRDAAETGAANRLIADADQRTKDRQAKRASDKAASDALKRASDAASAQSEIDKLQRRASIRSSAGFGNSDEAGATIAAEENIAQFVEKLKEAGIYTQALEDDFRAANDAITSLDAAEKEYNDTITATADVIGSTFDDLISGAKSFEESLQDVLVALGLQIIKTQILNAIQSSGSSSSSIGGAVAAGIAGAFATTGIPSIGKPALVGENGPEVFVPQTAGKIESTSSIGNTVINNYVTVQSDNGRISKQSDNQLRTSLGTSIQRATQRNG